MNSLLLCAIRELLSIMNIQIVKGKGSGKTELSAFDHALQDAGINNYNLIYLSSIIPPGSEVSFSDNFTAPDEDFGHRLYIVKAEKRSGKSGTAIAAGLGWYQKPDDKRGVFVEHQLSAPSAEEAERQLRNQINNSLVDLCHFRGYPVDDKSLFNMSVSTLTVDEHAGCVLVAAVYSSESW